MQIKDPTCMQACAPVLSDCLITLDPNMVFIFGLCFLVCFSVLEIESTVTYNQSKYSKTELYTQPHISTIAVEAEQVNLLVGQIENIGDKSGCTDLMVLCSTYLTKLSPSCNLISATLKNIALLQKRVNKGLVCWDPFVSLAHTIHFF